jgi:putative transposase
LGNLRPWNDVFGLQNAILRIDSYAYWGWIDEWLKEGRHFRHEKWTDSVAVGSEAFVTATKEKLGFKAKGREVIGGNGSYELREPRAAYKGVFGHKNGDLRPENTYFWDDSV